VFRRDSPPTRSRRSTGSGGGELQRADKCEGECSTRKNAFINEVGTSARSESKQHPSTFTNGPGQPLRSFSWTVASKYPSCTAFPSTLVSMLELYPPLPSLLLLRFGGLSRLNTRALHLLLLRNVALSYFAHNNENSSFHLLRGRSQWPRGVRHELSSPAPTLRSLVRILLRHGCLCVFCVRFFLFLHRLKWDSQPT
jgi:hypothetical protein